MNAIDALLIQENVGDLSVNRGFLLGGRVNYCYLLFNRLGVFLHVSYLAYLNAYSFFDGLLTGEHVFSKTFLNVFRSEEPIIKEAKNNETKTNKKSTDIRFD